MRVTTLSCVIISSPIGSFERKTATPLGVAVRHAPFALRHVQSAVLTSRTRIDAAQLLDFGDEVHFARLAIGR